MARLILVPLDLNKNEIQNGRFQNLASAPSSPVVGQFYYDTVTNQLLMWNGSDWVNKASDTVLLGGQSSAFHLARANHTGTQLAATVSDFDTQVRLSRLDQMAAPTADVSLNTHKLTGVVDPTNPTDAATKAYVDALASGLDAKASVRVATTAAGTLASSFENGDTIDGVALVTGNRILIKDQAAGAENGIYTVNASGAPTRATDADASAEVTAGMFVFVEEGTANGDTGWVLTTNAAITLGTTALVFAQFSSSGVILAGAGLLKTGSTIDFVAASGSGLIANADNVDIDPTNGVPVNRGGTGAITAAGAKTNLAFMTRYAADVGDGAATSFNIDHNLGTKDVQVTVYRNSDGVEVMCDMRRSTTNRVILDFATAPASAAYRVVVIG